MSADETEPEQLRKLFIGGLHIFTNEDSLRSHFEKWGEIVDCFVIRRSKSKESKGFGFIVYKHAYMADDVQAANPHTVDGREVEVKLAVPREDSAKLEAKSIAKKAFVLGIKEDIEEKDLKEYFGQFGNIVNCSVVKEKQSGKKRGFAFVEFDDYDPVDKISLKRFHVLKDEKVEVRKAVSRKEMDKKKRLNQIKQERGAFNGRRAEGGRNEWRRGDFGERREFGGRGGRSDNSSGNRYRESRFANESFRSDNWSGNRGNRFGPRIDQDGGNGFGCNNFESFRSEGRFGSDRRNQFGLRTGQDGDDRFGFGRSDRDQWNGYEIGGSGNGGNRFGPRIDEDGGNGFGCNNFEDFRSEGRFSSNRRNQFGSRTGQDGDDRFGFGRSNRDQWKGHEIGGSGNGGNRFGPRIGQDGGNEFGCNNFEAFRSEGRFGINRRNQFGSRTGQDGDDRDQWRGHEIGGSGNEGNRFGPRIDHDGRNEFGCNNFEGFRSEGRFGSNRRNQFGLRTGQDGDDRFGGSDRDQWKGHEIGGRGNGGNRFGPRIDQDGGNEFGNFEAFRSERRFGTNGRNQFGSRW